MGVVAAVEESYSVLLLALYPLFFFLFLFLFLFFLTHVLDIGVWLLLGSWLVMTDDIWVVDMVCLYLGVFVLYILSYEFLF